MRKFPAILLLTSLGIAQVALAQETDQDQTTPTSTAEAAALTKDVYEKSWNVTPRVGVIGYQDGNLTYTSRALEGLTTNFNLASMTPLPNPWNVGLELGLLYTHTGSPGANFFGTNPAVDVAPGSNAFIVPMDISLGYKATDKLLLALNFGPQVVYRSIPSSMHFGRDSDLAAANQIDVFPGVGANIGLEVSKQVALSLRADYIPTPSLGMFTTTLGATIGLA